MKIEWSTWWSEHNTHEIGSEVAGHVSSDSGVFATAYSDWIQRWDPSIKPGVLNGGSPI